MSKQAVDQYYESSDSNDTQYTVTVYDDGSWACSCKRWTTHVPREDCKHIKRRKEKLGRQEKWQPEAAYVPAVPLLATPKPKPVPEPGGVLETKYERHARPDGF